MVDTPSDSPPNDKHLDERLELKPKGQLECEILGPKTTKINTAPPEAVFSSLFRGFGNIIYKALNWTTVSSLSESDGM